MTHIYMFRSIASTRLMGRIGFNPNVFYRCVVFDTVGCYSEQSVCFIVRPVRQVTYMFDGKSAKISFCAPSEKPVLWLYPGLLH